MKNILIISTDLNRENDPDVSLSIASLLCYLKSAPSYGQDFIVEHHSVNLCQGKVTANLVLEKLQEKYHLNDFDFIFLSCYVWSEYLVKPLISLIRKQGYQQVIGLGGYQITYSSTPEKEYPGCQIFINGYGESSLLRAITDIHDYPVVLREAPNLLNLPSPYLTKEIELNMNQPMVRMETLRGCPFRCSFCAHRDLSYNKVYLYWEERVFAELALFKKYNVQKINVLDPIFNLGQRSLNILNEIKRIHLDALVSLQTRFENIRVKTGEQFLELCSQLNVHLEFGVQSINASEYIAVNRPNKLKHIEQVIKKLNGYGISYEISLIYGLPNQTYKSFLKSIDYFDVNGCSNIKAYPLMLLKGTELYNEKNKYKFQEETLGEYDIPVVTSSNTFSKNEWLKMHSVAENLTANKRYL